jgi:hypothetical protein
MRKIIPPPTAFASFTGSAEYAGDDDAALSRNLAENVDLPAIFRTLDQGVVPGLILPADDGSMMICSGYAMIMGNDTITITFAPIKLLNISVTCTLDRMNPGGDAAAVPDSEWWLTATTESLT